MSADGERPPTPAEAYERFFVPGLFGRWAPLLLEHARPMPGERVLDVGCGTGAVARPAASRVGSGGSVIGLDPDPAMLEVARGLPDVDGAPVTWIEGRAERLPEGPFDLITCQQALQFVPDRRRAVREMRRALAEDGRAAISVWRGLDRQPVYRALIEAEARHLDAPLEEVAGAPFSMGDAEALRGLLSEAGFHRFDVEPVACEVRFPEPDRFVALTLLAASAVLPAFQELAAHEQTELIDAVRRDVDPVIRDHLDGDAVAFPMEAHIVVAFR